MNDEYQKQIEKIKEDIKKEYETELNKRISQERRDMVESIIKMVPELSKDKIMGALTKKNTPDVEAIDILNMIGKKGEDTIFEDDTGKLFNQKAKLVGFKSDDKYVFYEDDNNIELILNEDDEKIKKIGFFFI